MNFEKLSASLSNISFAFRLECSSIHKTFHSKTVDASCVNISLSAWQTLLDFYDGYNEQSILGTNIFTDLISFSGIIHATRAWDDEAVFMNRYLDYAPSELIAFRDDIFHYRIVHGFLEKDAWRGMNYVRKGLDLPVITEEMKHSRDKWVLDRCKRIEYLFPKAHAVENIMFRLKAVILPENTQRISTEYAVIDDTLDAHKSGYLLCDTVREALPGGYGTQAPAVQRRKKCASVKRLEQAQRRMGELDRLFIRIYEDNVAGRINDERFSMMSRSYETEQEQLKLDIQTLQQDFEVQERQIENLEQFIQRVHKYKDLDELTPYALRELVKGVYTEAPRQEQRQTAAEHPHFL